MILLDKNGFLVIQTDIDKDNIDALLAMKQTVLGLLATQDSDFYDKETNYWAFRLVEFLEPSASQICL